MKSVSVIIPCLNEEEGLEILFPTIPDFVHEVILVDNGSSDRTASIAKQYNARVIAEPEKGYGRAILRGLQNATGTIIVIVDGDSSYRLEKLEELCLYMEQENIDFLSGCRFPLHKQGIMPLLNFFANYVISLLGRLLFRIRLFDLQSGMMIFKRDILKKIKVEHGQMGFSQELKIKAWIHSEINCSEFHIDYYPRRGKIKFRKLHDALNNLLSFFYLWLRVCKIKCVEKYSLLVQ